jgi:hypothetical protein
MENPVPLSSDAFATWGKFDPNHKQYEEGKAEKNLNNNILDIRAATTRLYKEVIPKCAAELDKLQYTQIPHSSMQVVTIIHSYGINLRHLGHIRNHCETNQLKAHLLIEMLAR